MDAAYFRAPPAFVIPTPSIIAAVLVSLSAYLQSWGNYDKFADNLGVLLDSEGEQFDFIVVGGGSAGSVVANRLSESYRVLLLEAGGTLNTFQTIPAESHWSQGKGLGGTSNLNFLIQSRGNPKDFDNWANLTGDPSWSYENLLPYFTKSEDYHGRWDTEYVHGKGGLLRISVPEYTGLAEEYIEAAAELGYPRADLNGYYDEGFDTIYYPIKDGRRHGAYTFIDRAWFRLIIRKYSYVTKILLDGDHHAYGVEYEQHGVPKKAYASKEVILSAGAMNSPKILMLSGIGPREVLKRAGVATKVHLPAVGKNLQDHISTYLGPFFIDTKSENQLFSIERDVNAISIARFFASGTGVLTTSGTQAMGFLASTHAKRAGEASWPDIQLILAGVSIGTRFAGEFSRGFGPKHSVLTKYFAHAEGRESFLQIVSVGRPKARGTIRLASDNPHTEARIDPSYLDNQHDVDLLVEGIKKAVELVENTLPFKRLNGRFTRVPFPGCEHVKFRSDAYWECYGRHFSVTLHHIVGSCSMGRGDDPTRAVVDSQLRVIGVKGLRVIDASVMPVVPVGNTNAPTIMIGEKGADMILKDWEPPTEPPEPEIPDEEFFPPPTPAPTPAPVPVTQAPTTTVIVTQSPSPVPPTPTEGPLTSTLAVPTQPSNLNLSGSISSETSNSTSLNLGDTTTTMTLPLSPEVNTQSPSAAPTSSTVLEGSSPATPGNENDTKIVMEQGTAPPIITSPVTPTPLTTPIPSSSPPTKGSSPSSGTSSSPIPAVIPVTTPTPSTSTTTEDEEESEEEEEEEEEEGNRRFFRRSQNKTFKLSGSSSSRKPGSVSKGTPTPTPGPNPIFQHLFV